MVKFFALAGIMIATVTVTLVGSITAVSLILRLFGFRSISRFVPGSWRTLKRLSQPWYVFVDGILSFGWPVAFAYVLYHYFRDRYFGQMPATFNVPELIDNLVMFSVVGLWQGFRSWEQTEEQHLQDSSPGV